METRFKDSDCRLSVFPGEETNILRKKVCTRWGDIPFACLVVIVLLAATAASGKIIQVPKQYPTIQQAIDVARNGDVIHVSKGVFTGTPIHFKGKHIRLESLYGPEQTILDGQRKSRILVFDGGESNESVVSGFTIRNGRVRGNGGGILCSGSSPTIENCVIRDNTAHGSRYLAHGGGIAYVRSTMPNLIGCTLTRNNAGGSGGGLYVHQSNLIRIADCVFTRNVATGGGGGMYIDPIPPISGAMVEIENCTITGNHAQERGGGAHFNGFGRWYDPMSLRMDRCLIKENTADELGGGLYVMNFDAVIANCVIRDNTVQSEYVGGAGLYMMERAVRVKHCTIVDNRARRGGGGLHTVNCNTTVTSSILWKNQPEQISLAENQGALTVQYCDVQGGYPGTNNFDGNPLFRHPPNGDYRLRRHSPCIDSADPASTVTHDYAMATRPLRERADVGAFESEEIGNPPPQIEAFSASSLVGKPPFEVIFTCQATDEQSALSLRANTGLTYEVDFGDGKRNKNNTGAFEHTYTKLGIHKVTCAVKDQDGTQAHAALTVRVTNSRIPGGYETIQMAINAARNGDIIALPDGRYEGHGNYDLDFKGKAITLTSVNGPDDCIIDCGHRGRAFYFHSSENAGSVVSGLTLYDGYESSASGGAILCEGASPTIENCRIIECSAPHVGLGRGGAIGCTQNAAPKIKNCYIADNFSGQSGGAIGCWDAGSLTIEDCTIVDNSTTHMSGGAIDFVRFAGSASPKILRCLIEGNEAARHGGAINFATSGAPQIRDCIIRNNTAQLGAGGICLGAGLNQTTPVKIDNCILSRNQAKQTVAPQGAAIEARMCKVDMRNCTVVSNKPMAMDGAAITIVNNSQATLCNTIVWGTAPREALYVDTLSNLQATRCDVQGGQAGLRNINADPKFQAPATGDYRLKQNSPCLDVGAATGVPATDIAGTSRPQGSGYDIGAYEGAPDLASVGCTPAIAPPQATAGPPAMPAPTAVSPVEVLLESIGFHENWSAFKPGAEVVFEGTIMDADGVRTEERVTIRLTAKDAKGSYLTVETANMKKGRATHRTQLHVTCLAKTKRARSKSQGHQEMKLKGKLITCQAHEIVRKNIVVKTTSHIQEWRNATIPGGLFRIRITSRGPRGSEGEYRLVSDRR